MSRFPCCRRPGPGTGGQTAGRRETACSSSRRLGFDIARPIRGLGGLYRVIRRQQGLFYLREAGEITMDKELLYAKIEALEGDHPLAHRRPRR